MKYSPPEIETCRIAVEAADRTLAQSILGPQWGRPTTHCQNEAPAHINFQPKKLKGTVEVIHQLAGFKAPHSKDYPSWLKNFKFGVTDVSVKFTKKYYDSSKLKFSSPWTVHLVMYSMCLAIFIASRNLRQYTKVAMGYFTFWFYVVTSTPADILQILWSNGVESQANYSTGRQIILAVECR